MQEEHKHLTCEALASFYEQVTEAVKAACDAALQAFEEEVSADGGGAGGGGAGGGGGQTPRGGEGEVKRSFLQQAQLRSVCKKVTSYIP